VENGHDTILEAIITYHSPCRLRGYYRVGAGPALATPSCDWQASFESDCGRSSATLYESSFHRNRSWTPTRSRERHPRSQSIPDHKVGSFPNSTNPHAIRPQQYRIDLPRVPQPADNVTSIYLSGRRGPPKKYLADKNVCPTYYFTPNSANRLTANGFAFTIISSSSTGSPPRRLLSSAASMKA
jgi:hypothetical protein